VRDQENAKKIIGPGNAANQTTIRGLLKSSMDTRKRMEKNITAKVEKQNAMDRETEKQRIESKSELDLATLGRDMLQKQIDNTQGRGTNTVLGGPGMGAVEAEDITGAETASQMGQLMREEAKRADEKDKLKDKQEFKVSEDISAKVDTDIKKDYYTSLTVILEQIIEEVNGITFDGRADNGEFLVIQIKGKFENESKLFNEIFKKTKHLFRSSIILRTTYIISNKTNHHT
jgi:hypothetical protein